MNLLLDTHVLLWWLADDPAVAGGLGEAIDDDANRVFVSAAVVWEISIKRAAGKLAAPDELLARIDDAGLEDLPIEFTHALVAGALPRHHSDPFDRMLVAQAHLEGLTIATLDAHIAAYDVRVLGA